MARLPHSPSPAHWLAGVLLLGPAPVWAWAQAPLPPPPSPRPAAGTTVATVTGRIVDQQSGQRIPGAQVAILGTPFVAASDSAGRFAYAAVGPGTYIIQVRALGYQPGRWLIGLEDGDTVEYRLPLAPLAVSLDPVLVEGKPTRFQQLMREFEERRAGARGVFMTQEDIDAKKATTLVDVLRGVPGVRVACRSGNCVVEMTRSARGLCRADWVVDGFPATQSGTPHLPTVGIVAIEVYRSPNETPAQFLKSDSQCGVVVIWTQTGP